MPSFCSFELHEVLALYCFLVNLISNKQRMYEQRIAPFKNTAVLVQPYNTHLHSIFHTEAIQNQILLTSLRLSE